MMEVWHQVVYLLCFANSVLTDTLLLVEIRLVPFDSVGLGLGVDVNHAGRVEVKHSGTWGTICDDGWDDNEATVVCRHLGFHSGPSYAVGPNYFGRYYSVGSGQIWLAGVECSGKENNLAQCHFPYTWGVTGACDHGEDALVVCSRNQVTITPTQPSVLTSVASAVKPSVAIHNSLPPVTIPPRESTTVPSSTSIEIEWTKATITSSTENDSKHRSLSNLVIGVAAAAAISLLFGLVALAKWYRVFNIDPNPIDDIQNVVPDGNGSYLHRHMQPSTPTAHQLNRDTNYFMAANVKGLAYIMHNQDFEGSLIRKGSDVDFKNMRHVFAELGYQLDTHVNLTGQAIRETIETFSGKCTSGQFNSAAVILMSHGGKMDNGNDFIYGIDMEEILIGDIQEQLSGSKCRGMIGKPKLFIIQACRGARRMTRALSIPASRLQPTNTDYVYPLPSHHSIDTISGDVSAFKLDNLDRAKEDVHRVVIDAPPRKRHMTVNVPMNADMYLAFATPDGYVSLRHEVEGSWFIQAICEEFLSNAHKDSLDGMMTKVTRRVAAQKGRMYDTDLKQQVTIQQLPERITRLRKIIYFLPKYPAGADDHHSASTPV